MKLAPPSQVPFYWYRPRRKMDDVLNGIALDRDTGRLFITGKLWPKMFEIEPLKLDFSH